MTGMTARNAEVKRQADLNDFHMVMVATLVALTFLLPMKRSRRA